MTTPWPKRIALVAFSFMIAIVCMEAVLRLVFPSPVFSPLLPLSPHLRIRLQTNIEGVAHVAEFSSNSWGFRSEEPPVDWDGCKTIITVGGSTTLCYVLDDKKTWPYLLQQQLSTSRPCIWVGNAGIDGHTTRGHQIMMSEVLERVRPNIALFLTGINDLGLSLDETLRSEGNPFDEPEWWKDSLKVRILSISQLAQVLYRYKQLYIDKVETSADAHQNWNPVTLDEADTLPAQIDDVLPQLPEYEANIRNLITSSRELGVQPMFMTQPILFDTNAYYQGIMGSMAWLGDDAITLSAASIAKLMSTYNERLIQVCAEEHVPCLDLSASIPHTLDYFYDACHFTERGAALVAQKAAQFIADHDF